MHQSSHSLSRPARARGAVAALRRGALAAAAGALLAGCGAGSLATIPQASAPSDVAPSGTSQAADARAAAAASTSAQPNTGSGFATHVFANVYYGLDGVNTDMSASWLAKNVDMVEDDGYAAGYADAFKRAGGRLALSYVDPTFTAHCAAPFTPPAGRCDGPVGNLLNGTESAWVHDASGARLHRNYGAFGYQDAVNVTSAAAQQAYAATTAAVLAKSPRLDGFEADDSGSNFTTPDLDGGALGSHVYYGFSAREADIRSDDAWKTGESAMLGAAAKPVIVNGNDRASLGPAYNGLFLDLPNVMGQQFEGCYDNSGGYLYSDVDVKFTRQVNAVIAVQAHRKLAVCFPKGDMSPSSRLYAYASWLLTYDPAYSVYQMDAPLDDNRAIWPEITLVPTQPRFTATDQAQLIKNGVYVREFAACAIWGVGIGPCATVVNPHTSGAAVPALSLAYGSHIELDTISLYGGGRTHVVAGTPTTLKPISAAILVR